MMKNLISFLLVSFFISISSVTSFSTNAFVSEVTKPAQRIIALAPHIVEMLYEVGAGDKIIGTTEHADFPEAANNIPRVGNYAKLNIEQVLASDPDLIIAWKTGNPSDDLARLASFGLNIVYSQPKALTDVAKEIKYFAELAGEKQAGERVAQQYLADLKKIKAQYQDKTKVKVFYELWPRPLTTTARKSWSQQQLDVCQISNPFIDSASDYPQINVEQVVLEAPEIIIQPSTHGVNAPDSVNWQQWPAIPAVKINGFIHPNADKLHRMTSRSLEELALLCQQIDELRKNIKVKL